jgi:hypothetical protein
MRFRPSLAGPSRFPQPFLAQLLGAGLPGHMFAAGDLVGCWRLERKLKRRFDPRGTEHTDPAQPPGFFVECLEAVRR